MNISDAAQATSLSVKTIRYYEREGLITPDRKENGYRDFDLKDVKTLQFIRRARSFGFSISDCRKLIAYYQDPRRASADVKSLARKRCLAISRQIADLRNRQRQLSSLIDDCSGNDAPECAIIEGLLGEETTHQQTPCPLSASDLEF